MSILIRSATSPDLASQHWVTTGSANVYLGDGIVAAPAGATIIEQSGVVVSSAEYLAIRPLGNAVGQATGPLLYQHFMGQPQRIMTPGAADSVARAYPADNTPFGVEVRHKLFTGNSNPVWDGWGWRAEIVGGAASRDPSARAIGIYSDEACTAYLYTTGAFTQQTSAWQVDAQGTALTVWSTEYNPGLLGYANDSKAAVHHACLLGAAQEGHATLRPDQESTYHEFWAHDQGWVAPPVATWVDTGATIIALAGQVYRLSAVVTGLAINQPIRFGLLATRETKFNGYWPTPGTPSDYIQITPYVAASVGMKLWKWA